jgi:hypothetical protein
LIIAKLPLPIADDASVLVTGMNPALEVLDDLPKGHIGQMGHVDGDAKFLAMIQKIEGRES